MIIVSEEAVEKVSEALIRVKYNLKELFNRIDEENPRVAEYLECQAKKSKSPNEIIGTGVVVYLLLTEQDKIDRNQALLCGSQEEGTDEDLLIFRDGLDLSKFLEEEES